MNDNTLILTIFGDICPVADTYTAFSSGNPERLLSDEIRCIISTSDIIVGNLECAVTDSPKPIKKAGPVLYTSSKSVETLAAAGFSALSLANNHIRDCGSDGVESTIDTCKKYGISTFGAGNTVNAAKEPYIFMAKNMKIAFISFAEEEFNAVSPDSCGAAILDVYYDFERITKLRSEVDYLVVLFHGGIEYHPFPSPLLQKRCRRIAEAGADLILCQHSHCIGTYEHYGKATILYGQGNSLFGYRCNNDSWNQGLLVKVRIDADAGTSQIEFLPCQTGDDSVLHLCHDNEAQIIMKEFNDNSSKISSADFIAEQWSCFCQKSENLNIPLLLGWNRYLIYINRKLKGILLRIVYGRRKRNITHNLLRCESHHEVLRTILGKYNFK